MYSIEIKKRKNSRKYTPIKEFETEAEVIAYLKNNNIHYAGSPYFFTYIYLDDGSIIRQSYNGIVCSPEKLRDMMTGKETR